MRKFAAIEATCLFAFIMVYIWLLRAHHPRIVLAGVVFLLFSHAVRHEGPRQLGLGRRSLRECTLHLAPLLLFLALFLFAGGLLLNTARHIGLEQAFFALAAYLPWGIFQQYLLNGYFLNRFEQSFSKRTATWLAATLFAVVHTPNWFLMAVGLVGGWCAVQVYRRHRNLYFLGIAHATLGFLLYIAVPDSISHHLDIGPGLLHRGTGHRFLWPVGMGVPPAKLREKRPGGRPRSETRP